MATVTVHNSSITEPIRASGHNVLLRPDAAEVAGNMMVLVGLTL